MRYNIPGDTEPTAEEVARLGRIAQAFMMGFAAGWMCTRNGCNGESHDESKLPFAVEAADGNVQEWMNQISECEGFLQLQELATKAYCLVALEDIIK